MRDTPQNSNLVMALRWAALTVNASLIATFLSLVYILTLSMFYDVMFSLYVYGGHYRNHLYIYLLIYLLTYLLT